LIELSKAFHLQTSNNNYFKVSTLTFSQPSTIHLTIKFLEDPFTMHINIQSKAHYKWQCSTIFMDFLLTKLMGSKLSILHKSKVIKNKQLVTLLSQTNTAVSSNFLFIFQNLRWYTKHSFELYLSGCCQFHASTRMAWYSTQLKLVSQRFPILCWRSLWYDEQSLYQSQPKISFVRIMQSR